MFRVRSMLGDAVESNPYRFVAGLAGRSDSGRVLRLLRECQVAQALDAYRAPLLSCSGTMAVQLLRDQLDLAAGSTVQASGDAGLLIRWLSTDMGSADSVAVEALGRLVGPRGRAVFVVPGGIPGRGCPEVLVRGDSCWADYVQESRRGGDRRIPECPLNCDVGHEKTRLKQLLPPTLRKFGTSSPPLDQDDRRRHWAVQKFLESVAEAQRFAAATFAGPETKSVPFIRVV